MTKSLFALSLALFSLCGIHESPSANAAGIIPAASSLAPAPSENLRATVPPGTSGQVILEWDANANPDLQGYRIYGGTSPNPTTIIDYVLFGALGGTSTTITGLVNGTTYYFRVAAVTLLLIDLIESDYSNEVSVTLMAADLPPAPPQNLRAIPMETPGRVTLRWKANIEPDFLRYRIYSGTSANAVAPIDSVDGAAATTKIITKLTIGTTYYFRLTAVDKILQASAESKTVAATAIADAKPPALGTAAYGETVHLNSATPVTISVADPSGLKSVTLFYRVAGTASFSSQAMSLQSGDTYTQTIPAAIATNRGAEFYVMAQDQYNNTAKSSLYPLRVHCPHGVANPAGQPSGNDAGAYRLFSIPLDLDDKSPEAFLNANAGLGDYDNTKLRWFGVERATQRLKEYPDFGGVLVSPDMGFALLTNIKNVKLKTGSGSTVVTTSPYNLALPAGWNLIGNPFNFDISFDSLAVSNGAFELWSFEGDWRLNTAGLAPWQGYAIWLSEAATFSIRPGVAGLKSTTSFYSVENNDAENWLMQIAADNGRSFSRFNFVGQHELARDDEDELDLHPPVRLADGVEVVFTRQNSAALKTDIRKPSANGNTWEFTCRLNPEDETLALAFDGIKSIPPSFEVFLIDRETQTAYDLRNNDRLKFAVRNLTEKHFQLVAGTKAYLNAQALEAALYPSSYELLQNFPNPFNPATQIIYSLPEASRVEVSVYNARGERVAALVNEFQEIGSHTVVWNAEKVGTGVYFVRMRAGRFERIRKCVFVK